MTLTLDWLRARSASAEMMTLSLLAAGDRLRRSKRNWNVKRATRKAACRFRPWPSSKGRLRKRFLKQLRAHQEYIFHDSSRFFALDVPEQHAFRRAVRRLRYLRELGVAVAGKKMIGCCSSSRACMRRWANTRIASSPSGSCNRFKTSTEVKRLRQLLGRETLALQKAIGRELKVLDRIRNVAKARNGTG